MNIFVSDPDPRVAAQNLDNKRVNKMILESAQMLSLALAVHNIPGPKLLKKHRKHPCITWAQASQENYIWLLGHLKALLAEFKFRKNKGHAWQIHYNALRNGYPLMPKSNITLFPNCTYKPTRGVDFRWIQNPIEAYRKYLVARWKTDIISVKWGRRGYPKWLKDYLRKMKTWQPNLEQ